MAKRTRRKIYSPSTKYKMSIAHKGSKNGMYNKHHSEETKKKISQKLKEYWKHIVIE
jgi:predicted transcriptional regulator